MLDIFDDALAFTLAWEGGYVNDPDDPGGATNRGITQRTYDAWRAAHGHPKADVRHISDAEVRAIYKERYWWPAGCHQYGLPMAPVVFDSAVNCGVKRAVRWLQRLIGARPDGIVGPETRAKFRAAAASRDLYELASDYIDIREDYYVKLAGSRPEMAKFLKGWLNRTAALRQRYAR